MIFYILFFLTILCLLHFGRQIRIKGFDGLVAAFTVIFIMASLRFDVGWDYRSYYRLIEKDIKFYDSQFARLEPLNRTLIEISQFFDFTQFYFIVTSFIICFSFYYIFKRFSTDVIVSTLLFLSLPIFFFNSLSIVRQFTAVAIVFYGFQYVRSRMLFRFLVVLVIATLFHKSALVAAPLYFLYGRKPHFYFFPMIYLVGFLSSDMLYWLVEHLLPQYLKFLDRSIGEGGNKVLLLFQSLGFILLFFINKLQFNKKENDFYFLTFYIGLFVWSGLAQYGHAGFRGSLYYTVFMLLLVPNILIEIKQKRLLRELVYISCLFFFVFTLYLGKINPKKDANLPYRVFFFKEVYDLEEPKEIK